MKAGKISEAQLKRSVFRQLHKDPAGQRKGPGVGLDASVIVPAENERVVLSLNPVTCAGAAASEMAVYRAINDVAAGGAKPVGILVSVLLPTSANEAELRERMKEMDRTAEEEGLVILGGHTEVTRAVKEIVLTVTGVGLAREGAYVSAEGARPGMDILVTNWIGLEGTYLLARNHEEELAKRYAAPFIDKAKALREYLPVRSEAAVAVTAGAAAIHNGSHGGIYGALWELAEASGVGLEIDLKKIPVRQETIEICEFFDLNPYKLAANGCLVMAAVDGNQVVREIEKAGGRAAIIGKATDSNDRVLLYEEERRFLETTQTDELMALDQ